MGSRKKSSSKKKSSKNKRLPKISSKMRKRKSRRNKSKKVSSSEDDTSSSDYSSSPQSSSSSSSEDDYSRKSRRRSRDVKRVKKRTRRRSSSRDVSEGSPPAKKRKRSNSKSVDYGRKLQKKKRRRYASISSRSSDSCSSCQRESSIVSRHSDSRSCSPCQYGTASGREDIDFRSPGIKSSKKIKEERIPDEPSIEKRSGSRGPSGCSCNDHVCSCDTTQSGKGYMEENYPKRLRSVITIPEKTGDKEGEEQATEILKDEISNKHHACPSCRSYDNNDLESKQTLASCSCFSSDQTMQVENLIIDDACPPNNVTFGPTKVGGGVDPHPNKVKEASPNEGGESGISDNNANSFENLETVLRKKALENLQKFRKELQTNLKSDAKEKKIVSDVNQLSPSKTQVVVPYKSPVQESKEGLTLNQGRGCRSELVINEVFSHSAKIEINTPVEENSKKGSGCIKQCIMQPDRSAVSQGPKKDHTTGPVFIDEPEPGKLLCNTTVLTYNNENSLASKRNIIKTSAPLRAGALTTGTSDNLDMGAVNASIRSTIETNSSVRSTSEGNTSKHQPDETKDGSQFEQKTMSVMRGGEMVQVNYKVYIPKRASALARRQLKR